MSATIPRGQAALLEDAAKLQREHSGPFRVPPHHDFLLCENTYCAVQVQELQKGQSCKADIHHSVCVCGVLGPLQCHSFPSDIADVPGQTQRL